MPGISWSPHLSSSTSSQHTQLTKQSCLRYIKFCYVCVAVMKETEIRSNQLLFCKASLNQAQLGSQVVYLQSPTVASLTRKHAGSWSGRACPILCHIGLCHCSERRSHWILTYRTHLVRGRMIPLTNSFLSMCSVP